MQILKKLLRVSEITEIIKHAIGLMKKVKVKFLLVTFLLTKNIIHY